MNSSNLSQLKIDPTMKRRPRAATFGVFALVLLVLAGSLFIVWLRSGSERRLKGGDPYAVTSADSQPTQVKTESTNKPVTSTVVSPPPSASAGSQGLLTVSGYIINRERIEISPRFQGLVAWIGVKKGDRVEKDQILVRLEDSEQRARLAEAEGRLASSKVALERAEIAYGRAKGLREQKVIADEAIDEARLGVDAAKASMLAAQGMLDLARANLDWTVIRSPVSGVVLEKMVEPGELVTPISFGGPRGPSTALVAVADPSDLQVEVDLNEADLAKVGLGARCRVVPEAYPSRSYEGIVAEVAPEANRQKGTLQIKVQILQPDKYLTPELSAKVEFLP